MLNYIQVKVEKVYEDEIKGNTLRLQIDPMYRRTYNKRCYGIANEDREDMGIKKGDKVYFHYNETDHQRPHPSDDSIKFISKDFIFCYVRDGKITPIKGFCICEPYYGENIVEVEVDGKIIRTKESNGITISTDIKPHDRIARLKYVSDESQADYVGKLVHRAEHTNLEYSVEGENLYIFEDDLIFGVYES